MDKIRQKILIIGGAGFIGTHLIKFLINKKYIVSSLSLNYIPMEKRITKVRYIFLDINKFSQIQKKIKDNYNYVVNLSGYVTHNKFEQDGYKILENNFSSIINLIKFFSNKKIKKFIQIGSSDEYGNNNAPQDESMREKPNSPYALSKVISTYILETFYRTYNLPIVILRPFIVFGPGQKDNRLIPYVIKNCIKNKTFFVSEGKQYRDFCYIEDFVKAIFMIIKSNKLNGEIINISSGKKRTVKSVILQIQKLIKLGKPIYKKDIMRTEENIKLYSNNNKIKNLTKWKPKISFNQGLINTINSYKSEK